MRPLVSPRRRLEDLQEVGWGILDWIDLALIGKVAGAYECSN